MGTLGLSLFAPLGTSVQSVLGALAVPLQAITGLFAQRHAEKPTALMAYSAVSVSRNYRGAAANSQRFCAAPSCNTSPTAPVKVLRVVDESCSAHSAGRMRISGRFADVCAELDRLSRQEAA